MAWLRKKQDPALPVDWIVVGLGNPGREYAGTRHNVGFELIERLAARHRIRVQTSRFRALYGQGEIAGQQVLLVKPLTYMNLSGQAVAPLARQFGVPPERVLAVADDLDLPVGTVRLKLRGSAGGHNGHKSLIALLRTQEYPRLKIGIGKRSEDTVDHVLGAFRPDERPFIDEAIDRAARACETLLEEGYEAAQRSLAESLS